MLTALTVFIGGYINPDQRLQRYYTPLVTSCQEKNERSVNNMAKFWFNTAETVRRSYVCYIDDSEIEEALTDVDRTNPDAVKDAINDLVRERMWDNYEFDEEYDSDINDATLEWDNICECADDYIEDEDSEHTLGEIE